MLIGLLSDTHIHWPGQGFHPQIKEAFKGVDLILHAGDIWIPWVLDELESVAPVLAARGDDDLDTDIGDDKRVAKRHNLSLDGLKIWVTHIKPRYGLINPKEQTYSSIFGRQEKEVEEPPPDVVVFGHTHYAEIEDYKGTLLVNPGSPTLPTYLPKLGTVVFLDISNGRAEARIVQLE